MNSKGDFMKKKESKILVKDHTHPATVVVQEHQTIEAAINVLRKKQCDGKIIYFYVVDSEERLQGIVSARSLLLAEPQIKVREIMEPTVYCLEEDQNLEEAMEALSNRRLLALPVVDKEHRLKGVIDVQLYLEENIDVFKEQRNQDVFQLLGMTLEEGIHKSPFKTYKKRMPWIFCNMIGGIACAIVSNVFQLVLGKVLILAMFIPLVLSLSESISMQSMTQSFHILKKQHISFHRIFVRMFAEIRTAILMAITSGVLVGALSLFWGSGLLVSTTIAAGIFVSVSLSAVIGSSIPLLLHLKQLDPKVASGPVVLTISDVITTTLYLFLATWWLL
jgi:magnesium transporter